MSNLTPRQREVLAAYVTHETYKEAGYQLGTTEHMVKDILHRAHLRLDVHTTLGLLKAVGWLQVPE